ncbi:hypothetical protein CRUP_020162, partial [Coryphaenoides rupestris]
MMRMRGMLSRTEHRGMCILWHPWRSNGATCLPHSVLIHERLKRFEKRGPVPARDHASALAFSTKLHMTQGSHGEELLFAAAVSTPHESLLWVHDAVAQRHFEPQLSALPEKNVPEEEDDGDAVKIVSLMKSAEPLGATIKRDVSTGVILVARVMKGGAADKSGERYKNFLVFVRALLDYDPADDPSVPCRELALAFRRGDVLQVLSKEDDAWWQARRHGDGEDARAGLIPSERLHERALFTSRDDHDDDDDDGDDGGGGGGGGGHADDGGEVKEHVDYGAISGIHV